MRPVLALATAAALTTAVVQGCGPSGCTAIGSFNGVSLAIPTSLYVAVGSVEFEVCDDEGCASAVKNLAKLPGNNGRPERRVSAVTFSDLGRSFEPGAVQVHVELRDDDDVLVAATVQQVKLSRHHPNGEACDGDGWVNGALALEPARSG